MPVTNPCCCGCSLRTGTQIVAIVNIVLDCIACFFLLLAVLGFGAVIAAGTTNNRSRNSDPDNLYETNGGIGDGTALLILLIVTIVTLLVIGFQLIISIVLLIGANQGHIGKCRFWYISTVVLLVLSGVRCLFEISMGGHWLSYIFSFLIGFAITGYQLWVVHAFMEELKEGGPVATAGYVHGPGVSAQAYIYTKPGDGPGNVPPPYSQTQEGYVLVPLNNPQGPGYGYPPATSGYPRGPAPYPTQSHYPKLDAEKGPDY